MRLRRYLHLLRGNPDFSRLFAAQLISFAGDWFATVAILGLALELTGSPVIASLALVIQTGAFAVASPLAGVLADRLDRRRLMVAADLARVPVALSFLLARDPGTLWIAFVALALLSFGAAVFEPTSSASLPNLVEPDELGEANVLIGSAWGTMLAVGAALGGLVAAAFGRDVAFVVNARLVRRLGAPDRGDPPLIPRTARPRARARDAAPRPARPGRVDCGRAALRARQPQHGGAPALQDDLRGGDRA